MNNRGKGKIIGLLFVALIFMGIGFAVLQSNLNITGSSTASGTFDIKITQMTETSNSVSNGVEVKTNSFSDLSASISAEFIKPGDFVEYELKIENRGTIDALLRTSMDTNEKEQDSQGHQIILFTAREKNSGMDVTNISMPFQAGASGYVIVRIEFNSEAIEAPSEDVTFTLFLDASQLNAPSEQQTPTNPNNPTGNEDDWHFKSSNGVLTAYNPETTTNEDGYVVLSATDDDGNRITEINSSSFASNNITVLYDNSYNMLGINISYNEGTEKYNAVYNALESLLGGASGTSNNSLKINPSFLAKSNNTYNTQKLSRSINGITIYGNNVPNDLEVGYQAPLNIDTQTYEITDSSINFTKLDLSNAIYLQTIDDEAFEDTRLVHVIFPEASLTTIGKNAFEGSQLEGTVTIPSTVVKIDNYAFSGNSIEHVVFSQNSHLEEIGNYAFNGNQLTGQLVIPSSVEEIGEGAFKGSTSEASNRITSLVFESNSSLKTIGIDAFSVNQINTSLTIPASVESIGAGAFSGNYERTTNSISSLTFENNASIQTIGGSAFIYNNLTGTLTIPSSVEIISDEAFSSNHITSVSFGNNCSIESIRDYAFAYNNIRGTLTIPACIPRIENYVFQKSALNENEKIYLNIESRNNNIIMGSGVFKNCIIGGTFTMDEHIEKTNSISPFSEAVIENLIIDTCNQTICKEYDYGNVKNLTINGGVVPGSSYLFASDSITIGSGVTQLGRYAFSIAGRFRNVGKITIEDGTIKNEISFSNLNIGEFVVNDCKSGCGNLLEGTNLSTYSAPTADTVTINSGFVSGSSFYRAGTTTYNFGSGITGIGPYAVRGVAVVNVRMSESEWNELPKSEYWCNNNTPVINFITD